MKYKLIVAILSLVFWGNAIAFSQNETDIPEAKDTLCFKYDLRQGDTLYYRVVSYDSIIIDFDIPLKKTRYEMLKISVDSVIDNQIHLSQSLEHYIGMESKGDIKDVRRENSPWTKNKVNITIDSSGNRITQTIVNPTSYGLTPGGAFQPYIIFPLGDACKSVNESWLVKSSDTLAENGFPYPIMHQTSMMRVVGDIDTLGYDAKRLRYIKTAQGFYYILKPNDTTEVFARINSGGNITFDKKTNIPVHFYATIEQKLEIKFSDGKEMPGWHFISTNFTLDRLIRKEEDEEKSTDTD